MVQNPRETLRPFAGRPLNLPEPVNVEEGPAGCPVAIRMKRRIAVTAVLCAWRIDDEWWRPERISRLYYTVQLASGVRLMLFKDLAGNRWYRQGC